MWHKQLSSVMHTSSSNKKSSSKQPEHQQGQEECDGAITICYDANCKQVVHMSKLEEQQQQEEQKDQQQQEEQE